MGPWVPRSLAAAYDVAAARFADRPFVLAGEQTRTYEDVRRRSVELAGGLLALGIEPGDRVALLVDAGHAGYSEARFSSPSPETL